ncbi:insulinase family protein, partial [bacterium]|nr:insulinase family protein [bacterium]
TAIDEEIELIKTEGVSEREIERILNTNEAERGRALGSNIGLAFRVGMYQALRGDWRELLLDMERMKQVTSDDVVRVANEYFIEENRTVGWLVETASEDGGERGDEVDMRVLMQWVMTSLPEEEQRDLMMRFQSMSDQERQKLAEELWARMLDEQGGGEKTDADPS